MKNSPRNNDILPWNSNRLSNDGSIQIGSM